MRAAGSRPAPARPGARLVRRARRPGLAARPSMADGRAPGEDASSPVAVQIRPAPRRSTPSPASTHLDPRTVPAEAIIESEPGDWWTPGRRVRIGRRVAAAADCAYGSAARRRDPGRPAGAVRRARRRGPDGRAAVAAARRLGLARRPGSASRPAAARAGSTCGIPPS